MTRNGRSRAGRMSNSILMNIKRCCSGSLEITLDRPVDRQRYVKIPLMERGTPRNNVEKLNRPWKASGVKITDGLSIGFVSKRFLIETEQSHFPG
jgi:hypothetical protein